MPNKIFGRFNIKELTPKRLFSALKIRIHEIPNTIQWHLTSSAKNNRGRVKRYNGKHKGERCFIVANGPSIKDMDLSYLENEITFGLNRIYLLFNNTNFRPTYYICVNELILEQFSDEINQLEMPKFLNWNRRHYFNQEDQSISYVKSKMVIRDTFQYDLTKPTVIGATVTFVGLQIAYYMGFKQVIIIGLDHSYKEKATPSKLEVRTAEVDESHFHPEYFPKGAMWQAPDLLRSEIDFEIAHTAFNNDNRQILDATIKGKCNVFPKVDYFSLF